MKIGRSNGGNGFYNFETCTEQFNFAAGERFSEICDEPAALGTVVGVSLPKEISIKPLADVVTVDDLNKVAEDVLKLVRASSEKHEISVTTNEAASFIEAARPVRQR